MNPHITFVAFATLLTCLAMVGLHVTVSSDEMFYDITTLEHVLLAEPSILLALGGYFLMRGSRLARIGLSILYCSIALGLLLLPAIAIVVTNASIEALKPLFAAGFLLLLPCWILLFSRRLGVELAEIRTARHWQPMAKQLEQSPVANS